MSKANFQDDIARQRLPLVIGLMRKSCCKLAAALAAVAVVTALASGARADPVNFLTLTETSSDTLGVVASFVEIPATIPTQTVQAFNFSGNVTFPGNDSWGFGTLSLLIPADTYDGTVNSIGFVAWQEPDSATHYNLLKFHPDGNQGVTTFDIFSDLTLAGVDALGFGAGCRFDGGALTSCPILSDGQSYDLPTTRLQPSFGTYVPGGTLRVTFTDLGDSAVAVPEPPIWAMMLLGLTGLGFFAWRRSSKYKAAPAAA